MFMTDVFLITTSCNQLRHPSVDEWVIKMWYIPMMRYYRVKKKNETTTLVAKWVLLETIMLN